MPLRLLGTGSVVFGLALAGLFSRVPDTSARAALQPRDGATVYAATCAACHGADGLGMPEKFPPLKGSAWVTGSETRLVRILLHGLTGDIDVEGETFTGFMPTWGPMLDNTELAAVATYVRRSWGNKAPPVTPALVARLRTMHESRFEPWTAAELQQVEKVK